MFAAEVIYHNFPAPDLIGREAIVKFHADAGIGTALRANWEIVHLAAVGNVVLNERIDNLLYTNGFTLTVPVMGTLIIENGAITSWRDYFRRGQRRVAAGAALALIGIARVLTLPMAAAMPDSTVFMFANPDFGGLVDIFDALPHVVDKAPDQFRLRAAGRKIEVTTTRRAGIRSRTLCATRCLVIILGVAQEVE